MAPVTLVTAVASVDAQTACAKCGLLAWCLPAALDQHEANWIEGLTEHRRSRQRGGSLCHAGDELGMLYMVRSGSVKTSTFDNSGRENVTGFFLPGELIGMDAIATGKHLCSVIVLEDSTFCGIRYADFEQALATG